MQRCRDWTSLVRTGVLGALVWTGYAQAGGITAVTRRTVMSGVPGGAPANATANATGGTIVNPQPQAAASVLLPGQTPLARIPRVPGVPGGRVTVSAVPPPLRPGPGEALMARPASVPATPQAPAGRPRVAPGRSGVEQTRTGTK